MGVRARGIAVGLALAALAFAPRSTVAAPTGEVALDTFFHGTVIGLEGTKVRLRYDFSTKEQAADWPEGAGFRVPRDVGDSAGVAEGRLAVRGSTGTRHVAEWEGDITVTAKLIPDGVKDIGSVVTSPDQPEDYVLYSIGETYFHGWDHPGSGGDTGMMKFGKQYATADKPGLVGFRYLDYRRPPTDPTPGKPVVWSFGRKGAEVFLTLDDMKLDSPEPGNKLKVLQVGFYAVKSAMTVDDIVIEGTLSPRYLAAKKIALRTDKPIVAETGAGVDPAVRTLAEAYAAGKESAVKVVGVVGDAARPEGDRRAAADALKRGPRKALPAVIDLLYNAEPKIRTLGLEIVKSLTGKTYGYDPKASEKARAAAVRRLNDDIAANPALLQGNGGGG
ncbi:MAG: hypothetical protein IT460_13265 [Planctomycetes bacterium]|nr:hypothetical protein [Planctomycetota bacterium]